jgi:hypothetical protein
MRVQIAVVAGSLLTALSLPALVARQAPALTAAVHGTVLTADGNPAGGFYAALLPADRGTWASAEGSTLRRAAVDAGRFDILDVPSGQYSLVFATGAMLADWPSMPTLTTIIRRRPLAIALTAGDAVDVRVVVDVMAADVVATRFAIGRMQAVPALRGRPVPPGIAARGGAPAGASPAPSYPGAISGRVTDAEGRPAAGVEVRTMREVQIDGRTRVATFGAPAITEADGRYRLANRSAGDFVVVAAAGAADPRTRGLIVSPASQPALDAEGRRVANVSTFFGRVSDRHRARTVSVATDEVRGIDIQLLRLPVFDVTGTVKSAGSGLTRLDFVSLIDADDPQNPLSLRGAAVGADDAFRIPDVPNGTYILSASSPTGWAEEHVRIDGHTPDSVVMITRAPARVRGRVEFQGTTSAPAAVAGARDYGVELAPVAMRIGASVTRATLRPDLSFEVPGAGPGPFQLRGVAPAPWIQVAGFVDGVDTLDLPLSAGAVDTRAGVVVFADHPTALRVEVRDSRGRPAAAVQVIAFSDDARYWVARSRRMQQGIVGPDGIYTFTGLPPGRYFVAASQDVRVDMPPSAAALERLEEPASSIELGAAERRSVTIHLR